MRLVDQSTGEILDPLTFDEATELTESIRVSVADLEQKVVRAYRGRAWLAMEYESWDDYLLGEFKQAPLALPREERRTQVASLRQQGLSTRAIASATGVHHDTVSEDLKKAPVGNPTPDRIQGIDGKDYPADRPEPGPTPPSEVRDTPPRQEEACPTCGQILPAHLRKEG